MKHTSEVQDRVALLEAVIWAIEHNTELTELAYQASDIEDLDQQLLKKYGFGLEQCNMIRSMSAQRLTQKNRLAIRKELAEAQEHLSQTCRSKQPSS